MTPPIARRSGAAASNLLILLVCAAGAVGARPSPVLRPGAPVGRERPLVQGIHPGCVVQALQAREQASAGGANRASPIHTPLAPASAGGDRCGRVTLAVCAERIVPNTGS